MSSFMPETATGIKVGEVEQELNGLHVEREVIAKLIDDLATRLRGVLAERAPEAGSIANAPEPVRVPLAQALREEVRGLAGLSIQLRSIIDRIEL